MLETGNKAPDFSLLDDSEQTISLQQFRGKKVVLYFYPKDDTPGCTLESCGFRDAQSEFNKLNVQILGISRDDVKSHVKFKQKYNLNFPLLADTESKLCDAYDVIKEKNMYGKKYKGIERSTFLIDEQGNIQHIWRGVTVAGHIQDVLAHAKK